MKICVISMLKFSAWLKNPVIPSHSILVPHEHPIWTYLLPVFPLYFDHLTLSYPKPLPSLSPLLEIYRPSIPAWQTSIHLLNPSSNVNFFKFLWFSQVNLNALCSYALTRYMHSSATIPFQIFISLIL